ncbi:MAG: D-TA family PLP-dependent enzyme [Puia sp.]|nr:D-TA family PLP-dependent enzyme [Puia sp.]
MTELAAHFPWWQIREPENIDSPALIVYPERVKENIGLLVAMSGGDAGRLRPHVKTNKSKEAVLLMMEAGITKFKCATIAEAEMLGVCGAPDVLLAYQPVGPKICRLLALVEAFPATVFSCLIDNLPAARELSGVFTGAGRVLPVFIDLNVGMNRTGIAPGQAALQLYRDSMRLPGVKPAGLHAYDGHIRDKDFALRRQQCEAAFVQVWALRDAIRKESGSDPLVVAGGSPTYPIHAENKGVESSPGTFIYWDKGYQDQLPEQAFLPAALVIARVISLPDERKLCLDLGHKSVSAENELTKRVFFLNAPELQPLGQSEEHLVVEAGAGHSFKIGDLLYGLPFHVCPTVALHERALTVENGLFTGEWRTVSRDKKITI